jgi:hypothetical protein
MKALVVAVRLHESLARRVKYELVTIAGGKHGFFTDKDTITAYDTVWRFVDRNVPGLNLGVTQPGK